MAQTIEWIPQTFAGDHHDFFLGPEHVEITADALAQFGHGSIKLAPHTRKEANTLAILLKKASRRLEEIGKGLD